jgi:hypothetical protein
MWYLSNILNVRVEVFTAVKIQVQVLWVVTLCSLVAGYQRFRGPYCLHLQVEVEMQAGRFVCYHITRCHNQDKLGLKKVVIVTVQLWGFSGALYYFGLTALPLRQNVGTRHQYVVCVFPIYNVLNQLTDVHETSYERHAIVGHFNLVIVDFLQHGGRVNS